MGKVVNLFPVTGDRIENPGFIRENNNLAFPCDEAVLQRAREAEREVDEWCRLIENPCGYRPARKLEEGDIDRSLEANLRRMAAEAEDNDSSSAAGDGAYPFDLKAHNDALENLGMKAIDRWWPPQEPEPPDDAA